MKATALIAAAALAFGGAAFAQQHKDRTARAEDHATAEQQAHEAGAKMRNGAHRLGAKTRAAMHRLGDKLHARRGHDANDTRAMGASGDDMDGGRRHRMDDAYANWQARHRNDEHKR